MPNRIAFRAALVLAFIIALAIGALHPIGTMASPLAATPVRPSPTPTSALMPPTSTPTTAPPATSTPIPTAAATDTPLPPTATATPTATGLATATDTPTPNATGVTTNTATATPSATPALTDTVTATPTVMATGTVTATETVTATATATVTPTPTATPSVELSARPTIGLVAAGGSFSYAVSVTNTGQLTDTISLASDTGKALSTSFSRPSLANLPPGASAASVLLAVAPRGALTVSVPITLTATGGAGASATAVVAANIFQVGFDRTLAGTRVGQHKAPPTTVVRITVKATVSASLPQVTLIDYFPSDWGVVNPQGGTLGLVNGMRSITWRLGPVAAGSVVTAYYDLLSPPLHSPPAQYNFSSELDWPGGSVRSDPWLVVVADPNPSTEYLRAAYVTVGTHNFNTMTTTAPSGATPAMLAATVPGGGATGTLADGSGVSIFASDPVPSGQQWDLGGPDPWTASLYLQSSVSATVQSLVFSIYRLDTSGNATPIYRNTVTDTVSIGPDAYNIAVSASTVPSGTIIGPGERFGLDFAVGLDNPATVNLWFDSAGQPSAVTTQTTLVPLSPLTETHFRIGQDTPLNAMAWYGNTDAQTPGVPRQTNFRVRFQVQNGTASPVTWQPRLEWASAATGAWAPVATSSGSDPLYVAGTGQYGNGATIPVANFALGGGSGTAQDGVAYSTQNPGANYTLNANSYTEIEFDVQANGNALYYTAYSFRLSANGTAFTSFANYAQLSFWEPLSANSPHLSNGPLPDNCAACHVTHDDRGGPELRANTINQHTVSTDKDLCMACHDGTGARTDLRTEFNTDGYHHPIEATSGVHRAGEGYTPNWSPATNRHVECMDCHDAHRVRTGASTPGFGDTANNIANQWGVSPANPTSNWTDVPATGFTRLTPVTKEYQLCLKCHSSYAYGTAPPVSHSGGINETNQAREFNVNNASYHFVEQDQTAAGGATPPTADPSRMMTFVTGSAMSPSTKMNCSDCHASSVATDPRGTHGSTVPYELRGSWDTNNYGLCFQCHDPNTYGPTGDQTTGGKTSFAGDKPNLHTYHMSPSGGNAPGCQACHSAVPHGGQYRALLAPRSIGGTTLPVDDYNTNSSLNIKPGALPASGNWTCSTCH